MKPLLLIFSVLLTVLILSNISFAQESNQYTVTTWKISIPEGSSDVELNKIMKEFYDRVASQHNIVINEKILQGSSASDFRDLLIITEYAKRNNISAVGNIMNTLSDVDWLSKVEREKFIDTFWEYAEIFRNNS